MRILYGVTGCGLGHTMRARSLAQHLASRGHRVLLAASGRAVPVLRQHGLTVVAIDGMTMRFERGEMQRVRSLLELLRHAPAALAGNVQVALREVLAFGPQAVVTDFDSFAHAVSVALGVPIVSLDHQHVVDRFRHPREVRARVTSYGLARAVVAAKTPACDRYIVTSFFFPEGREGRATHLVGPVMRPEIEQATPARGDHVLVYQTASGDPRLLPALEALPQQRFVVYGLGREEERGRAGNVRLRAFDERRFVQELSGARAVIANGGFTTLAEAVYLGKPVLSVPLRRQSEQELNAAYVERLGIGVRADRIDPSVVARFLDREDSFVKLTDPRLRRGTADACQALDRALQEAA
jgi:uncharacterized protein (TIGR00661 family)